MIPRYLHDPEAIETESFRRIRALTRLDGLDAQQQQIALRVVHTCGIPEVVDNLHVDACAATAGIHALNAGAPILCDVEMLRNGISRSFVRSPCYCFVRDGEVAARARERGETRSMAALDRWTEHLQGSIAAIGNAPTALFRLLEMLEAGGPRPALIVAMPVGFVGAVESKQALLDSSGRLGVPSILLRGRQGGSAMAAAVVNALARLSRGITV